MGQRNWYRFWRARAWHYVCRSTLKSDRTVRSFHGRVGHVGDCQATILERVLRHSIKLFNKSDCASTWSAQEHEIMKEREPVAQSKFSNRPEASDNTVDRNLETQ